MASCVQDSLLMITSALDSSQHSDETTTGKHGSSEYVTAGQHGEWVLPDLILCPVLLADL